MKHAAKALLAIGLLFFGFVWLVTIYLGPNDLKACGTMPSDKSGCGPAHAIVAISGGDTEARANHAIDLYKNGWAAEIIFSGAAADKQGPSNARVMKQIAIDAGVDSNDVVIEESSETTAQNAERTHAILKERGMTSIILVTSAYHERRSMFEFQRQAGSSVVLRASPTQQDKGWSNWWWTTPGGWATAMSEFGRSLVLWAGGIDRSEAP